MSCKECQAAKECGNHGRYFNSVQCVYCAARLIQQIGKFKISASVCATRRKAALADSVAAGLEEDLIRKLAKGPMALEPEIIKERKKK